MKIKNKKANIIPEIPAKVFFNLKKSTFLIVIVTALVFSNALFNDFTNWDDNDYVTENPYIKNLSVEGVKNMCSVYVSWHYHPLTLLSLSIDYKIWGLNPTGYILSNILLHLFSVVLVLLIFSKILKDVKLAFFVAIVFAIHPMRVESVVWISERKDVLYVVLFLAALWQYIKYINYSYKKKYLFLSFIFATLSLFAKASAAIFPLILILIDYFYERKNYKLIIAEKIPFFTISLIFGLIAIEAQSSAVQNTKPIADHVFLFTYAIAFYIVKFFTPIYQLPLIHFPEKTALLLLPLKYYASALIIPAIFFVIYKFKNIRKELIFGFSFFVLNLILVLFKFPIGPAYLAERYTYLPYIGLAFIIAITYKTILTKNNKMWMTVLLYVWIIGLGAKTIAQNTVWRNSETLWTYTAKYNPNSILAYKNLANAHNNKGNFKAAIKFYTKALEIQPQDSQTLNNRGVAKENTGDIKGAIDDFTQAIMLFPEDDKALRNRAFAYNKMSDFNSAVKDFSVLINLYPEDPSIYNLRAKTHANARQLEKAIEDYNKAIELNPLFVDAFCNRGLAFLDLYLYDKALNDFNKALSLDEKFVAAYYSKGLYFERINDLDNAILSYSDAIKYDTNYEWAYNNRGNIYFNTGQFDEALSDFNKAISINPQNPEAYNNRGALYNKIANYKQAEEDFSKVINLNPSLAIPFANRAYSRWMMRNNSAACDDWENAYERGYLEVKRMIDNHCR